DSRRATVSPRPWHVRYMRRCASRDRLARAMRRIGWILVVLVAAVLVVWRASDSIGDAGVAPVPVPAASIERSAQVEPFADSAQNAPADPLATRAEAAEPSAGNITSKSSSR